MARQMIDIPILGVDKRPSERQAVPGLCEAIKNLEPTGPKERPYWKRVKSVNRIKNDEGLNFNHPDKDKIISATWHVRSSVGKYSANDCGSMRRLVVGLDYGDGICQVQVIDPDLYDGWAIVAERVFTGTAGDSFDVVFTTMSNTVVFSVLKNEKSIGLYFIVDDLIVDFTFPRLPMVTHQQDVKPYTSEEFEAGAYTGLRNGHYAYRYGFRLGDETVAMSPPIPFEVDNNDNNYSEIEFTLNGFNPSNQPLNFEFWKDMLNGVDVYLSDRYDDRHDLMLNGIYYRVVTFESIDVQEDYQGWDNPNIRRYAGKTEDLPARPVYDVSVEGNHALTAGCLYSYNSRLILGNVAVDFVEPPVSVDSVIAEGVAMSPIDTRSEHRPVQGDPFETYLVFYWEFRLTAFGGVFPNNSVDVTSNEAAVFTDIIDDRTIDIAVQFDESHGGNLSDVTWKVEAQVYETMDALTTVGEFFEFNYPEND